MLQLFQAHIQKWCKTTDKILLAISGGMDSMVLLHLFRESGYQVGVAHCNFQLRGIESDEDENFVREKCFQWGIAFYFHRFDTNNYAIERGLSVQMAARELRYAWFDELLEKERYDFLVTAHHLNDSIETILLNLTKGTGIVGLMGIPAQNKNCIRPLLSTTREEIETYAANAGVTWREDQSNHTDDYQRNFIRHQIVPRLKEINPSLEKTFKETIQKLQGAAEMVNTSIAEWKLNYLRTEKHKLYLDKRGLDKDSTLVLWEVLKVYGFNFDQCENITRALSGQSGKRFSSNSHDLIIDRENLILIERQGDWVQTTIEAHQQEVRFGHREIKLQVGDLTTPVLSDKNDAIVDESLVHFPLVWRKWVSGDYFFPLGMKNRKKISDFLIDEKVSLADKDSTTVLESNGKIIWIVGQRVDDRFKVTDKTKRVLKISFTQVG